MKNACHRAFHHFSLPESHHKGGHHTFTYSVVTKFRPGKTKNFSKPVNGKAKKPERAYRQNNKGYLGYGHAVKVNMLMEFMTEFLHRIKIFYTKTYLLPVREV